eukprot:TRINITY_DN4270_c0_g1_i15.p1 TRINITY_DN4270_c0_g1~~TRINITY_DN4270_c0_g1_i15.p1  ORF type:complete len:206 (-),score=19.63 TRINITY_DN4270_c0_g1_i15:172-789(-)
MNIPSYKAQPFPLYNCQVLPLMFPSPLVGPQTALYYPPPVPTSLPPKPSAPPRDDIHLTPSNSEDTHRPRMKAEKPHKVPQRTGTWTANEHKLFLEAMEKFGNDWAAVVKYIGTRSAPQIRSHAQKHYRKLRKSAIAKLKSDPDQTKAIFVVTQEYRNHSRTPKVIQKTEDKGEFPDSFYLPKTLGPMLAVQVLVNPPNNVEKRN